MAIMKLVDVPELTEFAGTEKIYVNDNGETKQISCDKVVTAGGGGGERIIWNTSEDIDMEVIVSAIENGTDIWILRNGQLAKILSFALYSFCGSLNTLVGSYLSITESAAQGSATVASLMLGNQTIASDSDLYNRLIAIGL